MSRFPVPIAEQIWDMKYRFKKADGTPIDKNVEQTWARIANALSLAEGTDELGDNAKTAKQVEAAEYFYNALEDWKYVPAGRIVAGAGTERAVTLFNCYVMGTIPDSMAGIFEMLKEAALTMQQGGGIGYDFSTIRPKSSWVKGVDSDASGPLSFMDCWDAMCRTVMSAGSRRGAMMATMRCDHPDIEDFITAKQDAAKLRMFNLSVLVTDDFMEAVDENLDWELVHKQPPKDSTEGPSLDWATGEKVYVHRVVKARDLWNLIMQSTYDYAEPGVIFIDRVNNANNLNYVEKISSTNPCGEQPLPPYGACLLGSINVVKFVKNPFTPDATIDHEDLRETVEAAVRMMDNVVDVSNFPLEAQAKEAEAKRRIGLGVTGLADALVMVGLTYGSDEAAEWTEKLLEHIARSAYWSSIYLAAEKGPFPLYDPEQYPAPGSHVDMLCDTDPEMAAALREHGIRNALLTSIAPTGTISLYAGNVSSGIEPMFAYGYTRKVLQKDGSKTEEYVEDYAVAAYREWWMSGVDQDGNPNNPEEWSEDLLPETFVTAQTLPPEAHVKMQAAAQKWIDSSISKTVNLPEDISFQDFKRVYWDAYESGCKGCTTYRPNDVTGSVLSVEEKPKEEPVEDDQIDSYLDGDDPADSLAELLEAAQGYTMTPEQAEAQAKSFAMSNLAIDKSEELEKRPEELRGSTYKIKIGDQSAVYLTVNDIVENDGTVRAFEIFLRSSDPNHDEWMVAMARTISAVLRRPYDASFLAAELKQVHSHATGGFGMGGYTPSLVAAIGKKLGDHMEGLKADNEASQSVFAPERKTVTSPVHTMFMDPSREAAERAQERVSESTGVAWPGDMTQASVKPEGCPKCHSYAIKHDGGCPTCLDCGWSKCG